MLQLLFTQSWHTYCNLISYFSITFLSEVMLFALVSAPGLSEKNILLIRRKIKALQPRFETLRQLVLLYSTQGYLTMASEINNFRGLSKSYIHFKVRADCDVSFVLEVSPEAACLRLPVTLCYARDRKSVV